MITWPAASGISETGRYPDDAAIRRLQIVGDHEEGTHGFSRGGRDSAPSARDAPRQGECDVYRARGCLPGQQRRGPGPDSGPHTPQERALDLQYEVAFFLPLEWY